MNRPWATWMLAVPVVGIFLAAGPAAPALVHDRTAILAGEVWRLVTGHIVHSDPSHLAINLAALLLLGGLTEAVSGAGRLAAALLIGLATVSAALLVSLPGLDQYCGLSGALNSLYAVVAVDLWRRTRRWRFLAAIAADMAKIAWELGSGAALFTATAWPAVPEAHLAGLAGGLLLAVTVRPPVRPARTCHRSGIGHAYAR